MKMNATSDIMQELSWEADAALSLSRATLPPDHTDHNLSDIDLLFRILTEHREQPPLPRPPPAPDGHASESQGPHTRTPRLVARGAAGPLSAPPSASCGDGMATSPRALPGTELLERVLERPALVVVEEPKDRGMRFRYECEGRSAGSILGASSTDSSKTQPAIEIQGCIERIRKVRVTASLVSKDVPHRPHPHCLVGKDCPHGSGVCVVTFNPHVTRRHSFANLGIQCVRRKELEASLQKRRSLNIDPFQTDHSRGIEDIDMNAVRLCFQCELEWEDGKKDCLKPVVSRPIYDKKATTTSQLKITRLNLDRGPCTGKTEVYMLCDKVQKDDIEIVFRRDSWKANGEFAQTDVHRQVGIVFKTPPYQDQGLAGEVEVSVCLRRISDQMESEPVTFTYSPRNADPYEVKRKRKIKSDLSFTERACTTEKSSPAADFQMSPPSSSVELLHTAPPGAFQGDACYLEPQSSSMASQSSSMASQSSSMAPQSSSMAPQSSSMASQSSSMASQSSSMAPQSSSMASQSSSMAPQSSSMASEEASLISQLLDMPGLMDILSDPSFSSSLPSGFEPDAGFPQLDVNSGPYFQDFSHYNDLQFNMLVNESQSAASEAGDGSVPAVQVKTEEEL